MSEFFLSLFLLFRDTKKCSLVNECVTAIMTKRLVGLNKMLPQVFRRKTSAEFVDGQNRFNRLKMAIV